MNGPMAQIAALTCHGNAFLQGRSVPQFFPGNSTCQFCERVTFVTLSKPIIGKPLEREIAHTPDAWFRDLQARCALGIQLSWTPQNDPGISDRMSAGFVGGGGAWAMEVLLPRNSSESWMARWEVGNQNAPDQRIWQVTYGRVSEGRPTSRPERGLSEVTCEITESLQEVRTFSMRQNLDGFTKWFDEALDTLATKGASRHGYHRDLAPQGFLSDEAATLLDASQKAWVFGGMGSWNDMGFDGEDQATYDRISERLFRVVNTAIARAATAGGGR